MNTIAAVQAVRLAKQAERITIGAAAAALDVACVTSDQALR